MPDQPKHTPPPWRVYGRRFYAGETLVGTIDGGYRNDNDDPRRIVACVNACEGIPTEELEKAAAQTDDRVRLSNLTYIAEQAGMTAYLEMSRTRIHRLECLKNVDAEVLKSASSV
jgi:hypothetical protein